MTTTTSTDDANVVTNERAMLLAAHSLYVQGGYSTPSIERARAEADIASGKVIDWTRIEAEVRTATASVATPAPAPTTPAPGTDADKPVDVCHVLAHIDMAVSLRERIAELTKQKDDHEGAIKAALGTATEGTDASGRVIVRYPHRSRHGLDKKAVKALLSDDDFAAVSRVSNYRILQFGDG